MAFAKRHPVWLVMMLAIATLLLLTALLPTFLGRQDPLTPRAHADEAPHPAEGAPSTRFEYDRFTQLRDELSLSDVDLAALACTDSQVASILTDVAAWLQANAERLEQSGQAVRSALAEVRETTRKINVGPRDEAVIARYAVDQGAWETATAARAAVPLEVVGTIEAHLEQGQRQAWATGRANRSAPSELKYVPSLTAEQVRAYTRALRHAARTKGDPSAALSVLMGGQAEARRTAQSNINDRLGGVVEVSRVVIPMPEETSSQETPEGGE